MRAILIINLFLIIIGQVSPASFFLDEFLSGYESYQCLHQGGNDRIVLLLRDLSLPIIKNVADAKRAGLAV